MGKCRLFMCLMWSLQLQDLRQLELGRFSWGFLAVYKQSAMMYQSRRLPARDLQIAAIPMPDNPLPLGDGMLLSFSAEMSLLKSRYLATDRTCFKCA